MARAKGSKVGSKVEQAALMLEASEGKEEVTTRTQSVGVSTTNKSVAKRPFSPIILEASVSTDITVIHEAIRQSIAVDGANTLALGSILHHVVMSGVWQNDGSDTFVAWVSRIMSKSAAYRAIAIAEAFVPRNDDGSLNPSALDVYQVQRLALIGASKLALVAKLVAKLPEEEKGTAIAQSLDLAESKNVTELTEIIDTAIADRAMLPSGNDNEPTSDELREIAYRDAMADYSVRLRKLSVKLSQKCDHGVILAQIAQITAEAAAFVRKDEEIKEAARAAAARDGKGKGKGTPRTKKETQATIDAKDEEIKNKNAEGPKNAPTRPIRELRPGFRANNHKIDCKCVVCQRMDAKNPPVTTKGRRGNKAA